MDLYCHDFSFIHLMCVSEWACLFSEKQGRRAGSSDNQRSETIIQQTRPFFKWLQVSSTGLGPIHCAKQCESSIQLLENGNLRSTKKLQMTPTNLIKDFRITIYVTSEYISIISCQLNNSNNGL